MPILCVKLGIHSTCPLSRTVKGNGKLFQVAKATTTFLIFYKNWTVIQITDLLMLAAQAAMKVPKSKNMLATKQYSST